MNKKYAAILLLAAAAVWTSGCLSLIHISISDAVSSVSTIGYAGILLAPALLGFIGRTYSLYASFSLVTVLLVVMAAISLKIVKE